MSARQLLLDLLTVGFPPAGPVVVLPHPTQIDPPAKSTVMLRLDEVSPGAARGVRSYTFALVLLAGTTAPEGADVELESLLEDVLAALDTMTTALAVTWGTVRRGTYRGTIPAFEIPTTAHVAVTS